MKSDIEKKLDRLLAGIPKREYDLDTWLEEDETAEFDRLAVHQPMTHPESCGRQVQQPRRTWWRWVSAAACLLMIIGIGVTMMKTHQKPSSTFHLPPSTLLPCHAEKEVGAGTSKTLAMTREDTLQPPLPLLDRPRETAPKRVVAQAVQKEVMADTLGDAIWQSEENVVTALQMLSECEQTIRREEQEVRNAIIEATFNAVPRPANVILVSDENGAYEVVETKRIINI